MTFCFMASDRGNILVFDDGNERAAIVTGDLILFGEDTVLQARRWIEHVSQAYLRELADKIAGAVYAADSNLIAAGRGEVELSINRWIMTPDGAKWRPNPEGRRMCWSRNC